MIKDQVIEVHPIESPIVEVKVLYCPNEVSNKVVAEFLGAFGKVESITREMMVAEGYPSVETGTRIAKMSGINRDIPRRSRIGVFPIEIRYKGQIPQCYRCQAMGHIASTCPNEVVCFKCGVSGHTRSQCFKCFRCGKFGHIREKCPESQADHVQPTATQSTGIDVSSPPGADNSDRSLADDPLHRSCGSSSIAKETQSSSVIHPPQSNPPSRQSQDASPTDSNLNQPGDKAFSSSLRNLADGTAMDLDKDPLKRASQGWTQVGHRQKARPPK